MPGITSPGLGSGLDVNGLVTKLMAVEQQPLTALATKEASFQAKLSAFGSLKGALSSLQTAALTLTGTSTFTGMSASVSDTSVLTASADTNAAGGTYDIAVSKLAKSHTVRSNVDFGTATFDSGTLRITIGSGTPIDVDLTSVTSLSGVRDAINLKRTGVSASIINDGTADRLVLTSSTTGTSGAITIAAPTTNGDGARRLTDLVSANLVEVQPAQNAELTVNGLAISRSSNTISDVIAGVTLNLGKADATTPPSAKLTVARNTASAKSAIDAFVSAYNAAAKALRDSSAYNTATKQASILTGDSAVRNILSLLSSNIQAHLNGIGGGIATLSDIGIAVQKDGSLAVNSTTLVAAIGDTKKDVASLFTSTATGNKGIAVRFNEALTDVIGASGPIASRTEGIGASIKDIGKRREALNLRLAAIEKRYRAQFTTLDTLISSMQQTSTYLTQQLASLQSLNK